MTKVSLKVWSSMCCMYVSFHVIWYSFGNLHHIITVTKKLTRLQHRKDIKNNIFGLTCSFLYIARLFFFLPSDGLPGATEPCLWGSKEEKFKENRNRQKKEKEKHLKKSLWHRKSQKEQRAPSNSSSLKLEQMVVWLLVWLLYFG